MLVALGYDGLGGAYDFFCHCSNLSRAAADVVIIQNILQKQTVHKRLFDLQLEGEAQLFPNPWIFEKSHYIWGRP